MSAIHTSDNTTPVSSLSNLEPHPPSNAIAQSIPLHLYELPLEILQQISSFFSYPLPLQTATISKIQTDIYTESFKYFLQKIWASFEKGVAVPTPSLVELQDSLQQAEGDFVALQRIFAKVWQQQQQLLVIGPYLTKEKIQQSHTELKSANADALLKLYEERDNFIRVINKKRLIARIGDVPCDYNNAQWYDANQRLIRFYKTEYKESEIDELLAAAIQKCQEIKTLQLNGCLYDYPLTYLPKEIGNLTQLETLEIKGNNRLICLPTSIRKLTSLKEIIWQHASDLNGQSYPFDVEALQKMLLQAKAKSDPFPPNIIFALKQALQIELTH